MYCVAGWIFDGERGFHGYVEVEGGEVSHIGTGAPDAEVTAKGFVLPTLFNAHTHLGDAFIKESPPRDLQMAVKPPNGWKHMRLAAATREEVVNGMRDAMDAAFKGGTCHLADFREGGLAGIDALRSAMGVAHPDACILSRPMSQEYDRDEIEMILERSSGIGMSGISDIEYDVLERISMHCRREGRLFAMHASEAEREDIEAILDLRPSFLVHMCKATDYDLALVREAGVGVVSCPRSNLYFGIEPALERLLSLGVETMLGTDNAMIAPPSISDELLASATMLGSRGGEGALRLVTSIPRKTFKKEDIICLAEGLPADLAVFAGPKDPKDSEIWGAIRDAPTLIARGERVWRNIDGRVQEDTDTN